MVKNSECPQLSLSLGDEKCKAQLLEKCTPGRDYFNDVFLDKMRE
jgi:hypothetical protein